MCMCLSVCMMHDVYVYMLCNCMMHVHACVCIQCWTVCCVYALSLFMMNVCSNVDASVFMCVQVHVSV